MRVSRTHALSLPLETVANATFPFDERFAAARAYLAARGIREPRALYGARARITKLSERLAPRGGRV